MFLERKKKRYEQKQSRIHATNTIIKLYDLHQDIWNRGKKQKRKEDEYYEKYDKNKKTDNIILVNKK
jgi:hypothetical protein